MTADNERNPKSPKVHLQAPIGPFSLAPLRPVARVQQAPIWRLLEPLGLPQETELQLLKAICTIMGEYIGPLLLRESKADHAASIKAIERIAKDSEKLAESLGVLANHHLFAIEEQRGDPDGVAEAPKFDFFQLVPTLERLSDAAARVHADLKPQLRGTPSRKLLDGTVERLRTLFEQASLEVIWSESGSRVERLKLGGPGGDLLVAIFREFDPQTDSRHLTGALKRLAASLIDPDVKSP